MSLSKLHFAPPGPAVPIRRLAGDLAPTDASDRARILYALHSGNLFGTERMALATADALAPACETVFFAPPGPFAEHARARGYRVETFTSDRGYLARLLPYLWRPAKRQALFATRVWHSAGSLLVDLLLRSGTAQIHLVHGGAEDRLSYGRKPLLNRLGVRFVAVSSFVEEQLARHGVDRRNIAVIGNFLSDERRAELAAAGATRRHRGPVRRVLTISRADPIKELDLLIDAIAREPALGALDFTVLGSGSELARLQARARKEAPNVHFEGFSGAVPEALARADLLLHTCSTEPFGLAILEAMAAGVPVLTPDGGGAARIVEPGETGFHFASGSAAALATRLLTLAHTPGERLEAVARAARGAVEARYSARAGARAYRGLLQWEDQR